MPRPHATNCTDKVSVPNHLPSPPPAEARKNALEERGAPIFSKGLLLRSRTGAQAQSLERGETPATPAALLPASRRVRPCLKELLLANTTTNREENGGLDFGRPGYNDDGEPRRQTRCLRMLAEPWVGPTLTTLCPHLMGPGEAELMPILQMRKLRFKESGNLPKVTS